MVSVSGLLFLPYLAGDYRIAAAAAKPMRQIEKGE